MRPLPFFSGDKVRSLPLFSGKKVCPSFPYSQGRGSVRPLFTGKKVFPSLIHREEGVSFPYSQGRRCSLPLFTGKKVWPSLFIFSRLHCYIVFTVYNLWLLTCNPLSSVHVCMCTFLFLKKKVTACSAALCAFSVT